MPTAATKVILGPVLEGRRGVAALNVVNDLEMKAGLAAAVERNAPLSVQTVLAPAEIPYRVF